MDAQAVAFVIVFDCPAGRLVHWRSALSVPAALTYVPGAQPDHGVQLGALAAVLNMPVAHAMHVGSTVAVPTILTRSPGTHSVHGAQAVAGSPS